MSGEHAEQRQVFGDIEGRVHAEVGTVTWRLHKGRAPCNQFGEREHKMAPAFVFLQLTIVAEEWDLQPMAPSKSETGGM